MTTLTPALDAEATATLGREFLTWLWFRCEADGGVFDLPTGSVGIALNEYVALTSTDGEREESVLKRGSPHTAPEARTALRAGKLVKSARLEVGIEDRAYQVTVEADTLDLRSVRYPKLEDVEPQDRDLERLSAMEELADIVSELYARFLEARTADGWERGDLLAMQAWAMGG